MRARAADASRSVPVETQRRRREVVLILATALAVLVFAAFGPSGEGYVRFALVENTLRIRQAVRGIRKVLRRG